MGKPTKEAMLRCLDCDDESDGEIMASCPIFAKDPIGDGCDEVKSATRALIEKYGDGGPKVTMEWCQQMNDRWCGPCIHDGEPTEVTGEQIADDLRSIGVEVEGDTNEHQD